MLLNISVFMWFGCVCPWVMFRVNDVIPLWRLVLLGILILLLRRIPIVLVMRKKIHQIEDWQQAAFMGYFGPIGVSAIFYLYISIEFLNDVKDDNGEVREDARKLEEVMTIVIWFLAICSIVGHGLSVPMGKLGYHLPRTVSQALSQDSDEPSVLLSRFSRERGGDPNYQMRRRRRNERKPSEGAFQVGASNPRTGANEVEEQSAAEPARPVHFVDSGQVTPEEERGSPSRQLSDEATNGQISPAPAAKETVKTS